MTLPSPNLDNRTFQDLVDEARTIIAGSASRWTDYNPSDPGMTLDELFAWLAEMLIFQTNEITEETQQTFLRLLNEPGWVASDDLQQDIMMTQRSLRECTRAVTSDDYETLAKSASSEVLRAKCVPGRDLTRRSPEERAQQLTAHVSVVIVPNAKAHSPSSKHELLKVVSEYLEKFRLVTTRLHVVAPVYSDIRLIVTVRVEPSIADVKGSELSFQSLEEEAQNRMDVYFSPTNDEQSRGVGQHLMESEVYSIVESIPGIRQVEGIHFPDDPKATFMTVDGRTIGLKLEDHELPHVAVKLRRSRT